MSEGDKVFKILITMFAWHLHNSSGKCSPLAKTNISVKSQQPMRRLAFEAISQTETKSAQSRKPRRRERERRKKRI
jgi:hypothetical protein